MARCGQRRGQFDTTRFFFEKKKACCLPVDIQKRQPILDRARCPVIRDEFGATAIEYGLIAAGIAVAIITVVASVGTSLDTVFNKVATALK